MNDPCMSPLSSHLELECLEKVPMPGPALFSESIGAGNSSLSDEGRGLQMGRNRVRGAVLEEPDPRRLICTWT